jgi:hypothetical protein
MMATAERPDTTPAACQGRRRSTRSTLDARKGPERILGHDLGRRVPGHGSIHNCVRISLPTDDPFGPVHEKCREPPDPVAEDLPHPGRRVWIDQADQHAASVLTAHGSNPVGDPQELRLDVLRVLVDLLCVHLLADPRSLQERLAVGSVGKAAQHRRHDVHGDGSHGIPPRPYEAVSLACRRLSSALESHPAYLLRPLTIKVG